MILSDEQREVVESDDDHILVVAGAGCGKTTTLVNYIERNVSEDDKVRIIALTFSNKAADDIRDKLIENYPDILDRLFVGTIHSFCLDIVRSHGQSIGVNPNSQIFESDGDRLQIFRQAIMGIPSVLRMFEGMDPEDVDKAIQSRYRYMSRRKITLEGLDEPDAVEEEYNDLMRSMDALDYDDIIICALRIMTEQPRIARRYRGYYSCICVDEAQDLNRAQYSFVRALAGDGMRTVLVGDPNQAIYGFAGASHRFMCVDYLNDFNVRRFELKDNYRSSRRIVEAAQLIESGYDPVGRIPIEGEFQVNRYSTDTEEACAVAQQIGEMIVNGHPQIGKNVPPERICVMARRRNLLDRVKDELDKLNIESTMRSGTTGPTFDSSLFRAVWAGIRVAINDKDSFHRAVMEDVIRKSGLSNLKEAVDDVISVLGNSDNLDERALGTVEDMLGGFIEGMEENSYNDSMRDLEEWCSIVGNYLHNTLPGNRSLSGLVGSFSMINSGPSSVRGVSLSTVHMSKGLEFDAVFIISVNEGIFPDYRTDTEKGLDEERHNMFVSVTRAKRVCRVSYVELRTGKYPKRMEPSRFLEPFIGPQKG